MSHKALLETEGYLVMFEIKTIDTSEIDLDVVISFQLNSQISAISFCSDHNLIAKEDLQRLIVYFIQHIENLKQDPDTESFTFVPMDLAFQLQALSGEIRSQTDGEFGVRMMINVGRSCQEASSTYLGGESTVTLESIQNFITSIDTLMQSQPSAAS